MAKNGLGKQGELTVTIGYVGISENDLLIRLMCTSTIVKLVTHDSNDLNKKHLYYEYN